MKIKKINFKKIPILKNIKVKIDKLYEKIRGDLKLELVALVVLCFVIGFLVAAISSRFIFSERVKEVTTTVGIKEINRDAENVAENLKNTVVDGNINLQDYRFFNSFIEEMEYYGKDSKKSLYITDLNGKVLYKSKKATEKEFSIFELISKLNIGGMVNEKETQVLKEDATHSQYVPEPIIRIFPLKIGKDECYFIYRDTPTISIENRGLVRTNGVLGILMGAMVFIILFIFVVNKKVKYIDSISDGIKIMAGGDLSYRIRLYGRDEVSNIAENINIMAEEIEEKIEVERKAERMKSELITNVSHDLRTPLTSIMGYIGLLKEKKYKSKEEMENYLEIAFNKSESLKVLIEDLFEYTKLNNTEMKINKTKVNISSMISQLVDEMSPVFDENNLVLVKNVVDEKIVCDVDPDKIIRVFENLMSNAIKYSYKPGTVVLGCYENKGDGIISIRNRGDNIPKERLEKLFERFYRAEESRGGEVGGTGLGLAIAKNIVTIHGGQMWAECEGNDITFFVRLKTCSS